MATAREQFRSKVDLDLSKVRGMDATVTHHVTYVSKVSGMDATATYATPRCFVRYTTVTCLSKVHGFAREAALSAKQAQATATEIREGVLSPLPPSAGKERWHEGVSAVMEGMGIGGELRPKAPEVVAIETFASGSSSFAFDVTQREKQVGDTPHLALSLPFSTQ